MNKITFTIITVVYNDKSNIEKTIKSIITQKFKNFQFIIIDGNSTDGTKDLINKYKDKINVYISEKDEGIYDAMNKGIKLSKGEYINFLNSGDTYSNDNVLQIVYNNIVNNQTKLLSSDFVIHSNDLSYLKKIKTKKITLKSLRKDFNHCHQTIFAHKDIIEYYNINFSIKADYEWIVKIVQKLNENEIVKIDDYLIYYLKGGFSTQNISNDLKELFILHKNHFGFLQVLKNLNIYIYRYIRHLKQKLVG
tara:strand:+ start:38 stop:787 length:750 start_codon:yes stop_codon:yes gene_type:complete